MKAQEGTMRCSMAVFSFLTFHSARYLSKWSSSRSLVAAEWTPNCLGAIHMNTRNSWKLSALTFLALFVGFAARADVIHIDDGVITGGGAIRDGGGTHFISGVRGQDFSVYGTTSFSSDWCLFNRPCLAPGSYSVLDGASGPLPDTYSLGAGGGSFVKDGITYACDVSSGFHGPDNTCGFEISIAYMLTLPDPGPSPPSQIFLTAPLTVHASFGGIDANGNTFYLDARGIGTATVTLQHYGLVDMPPYYFVQTAQYDFYAIPEPATLTLAGLGLLAVVWLCRRGSSAAGRTSSTDRGKHPADHTSA
ncbi:MAG: PEP-CTERM sorting domain-containing protein [Acidobacteriia bacterium]|nr:PEP-CTERM sorting domain-containing protein [Terriglobia bacterium]